jgi:hypothetical protein
MDARATPRNASQPSWSSITRARNPSHQPLSVTRTRVVLGPFRSGVPSEIQPHSDNRGDQRDISENAKHDANARINHDSYDGSEGPVPHRSEHLARRECRCGQTDGPPWDAVRRPFNGALGVGRALLLTVPVVAFYPQCAIDSRRRPPVR